MTCDNKIYTAAGVIPSILNAWPIVFGLDGLAIGPIMISALSFAFITYFTGNLIYSEYLKIPYISDTGELVIICAALIGAGLWWSCEQIVHDKAL